MMRERPLCFPLWATDAFYFRVVGWSYCYYLVTVMDDFSCFILAHKV